MAGDWLKMDCSTPDKPEVLAITARMGWDDPDLTVGKLFRVWRWFDQQTTNGNAAGVTSALLDRIAGVSGFAQAMQSVGWLAVSDAGLELPNFDKHNGATAKARAQTAKRVASHRASDDANAASNAQTVTGALAREEKRREEVKKGAKAPSSAKPTIPCPYQSIVDAYHANLPDLPRVKLMPESRQKAMRGMWGWVLSSQKSDGTPRAETADEAIKWLNDYFARAAKNDFITGRTPPGAGHEKWQCDLDYLLTDKGRKQVIEKTREAA